MRYFIKLIFVFLTLAFQGCGSDSKSSPPSASISSSSSSSVYSANVVSIKEYASFPIEVRIKDSLSSQGILG